jgi:putative transposase
MGKWTSFTLTVIDTFSRSSPALDARLSYRGEDVVQTLDRVCGRIGYPATIRVDQGSEFISRDLGIWAYARGVTLDFSRPASRPITPLPSHSTAASGLNA